MHLAADRVLQLCKILGEAVVIVDYVEDISFFPNNAFLAGLPPCPLYSLEWNPRMKPCLLTAFYLSSARLMCQHTMRNIMCRQAAPGAALPPNLREQLAGPIVLPSAYLRRAVESFQVL